MKYPKNSMLTAFLLFSCASSVHAGEISITQPGNIVFGQDLSVTKEQLKDTCDEISVREIKPAQIPGVIKRQMQLDCHGYEMAGKKRLAEFVYKDDKLLLVWILVNADELNIFEQAMTAEYGAPKYKAESFSAYTDYRTALRKDVPEFLFYAPEASTQFDDWFSLGQ